MSIKISECFFSNTYIAQSGFVHPRGLYVRYFTSKHFFETFLMLAQGQDIIPSMVIAMVKVFLRLFEPAFVVLIQFCFCVPLDLWISMSEKSL